MGDVTTENRNSLILDARTCMHIRGLKPFVEQTFGGAVIRMA